MLRLFIVSFFVFYLSGCGPSDSYKPSEPVIKPAKNKTELQSAIQSRNTQEVLALIAKGKDIGKKDQNSRNALHYAARYLESPEIIEALIDAGEDINGRDISGKSPLSYAIQANDLQSAAMLIHKGAHKENYGQLTYTLPAELERLKKYEAEKQREQKKLQQLALLDTVQPCSLHEKDWIYIKGSCAGGYAHGSGEAIHKNGELKFKGHFRNGARNSGLLTVYDVKMFKGTIRNGKPDGTGICFHDSEPEECKFYKGKRIDAIFKNRLAMEKQRREFETKIAQMKRQHQNELSAIRSQQNADSGVGNALKQEASRRVMSEIFNRLF